MDAFNFDPSAAAAKNKSFDAAFENLPMGASMTFTAEERGEARRIVTKHALWKAYAAKWAIDASGLDKRRISLFAHEAGISPYEFRLQLAAAMDAKGDAKASQASQNISGEEREFDAAMKMEGDQERQRDANSAVVSHMMDAYGMSLDQARCFLSDEEMSAAGARRSLHESRKAEETRDTMLGEIVIAETDSARRRMIVEAMADDQVLSRASGPRLKGYDDQGSDEARSQASQAEEQASKAAKADKSAEKEAARVKALHAIENDRFAEAQKANAAFAPMAEAMKPFYMPAIMAEIRAATEKLVGEMPTTTITVKRADGSKHKAQGHTHPQFAALVRTLSNPMANGSYANVLLVGGTGTGKTHACHQAAQALGIPYYHMGSLSSAHELVGFVDANGTYHDTPFVRAFRDGGLVLLDEVDSGDANATLAVNAALANGSHEFPQIGMIKRHPDFRCVAAANTWNGPTAEFIGRNKLDGAFLSRFPVKLPWNADTALELAISGHEGFCRRVQAARNRAASAGLKHNIDVRHAMAGAALIAAGFSEDEAATMTYQAGLKREQIAMIEGR
jgi:cobaltochelatase CobS